MPLVRAFLAVCFPKNSLGRVASCIEHLKPPFLRAGYTVSWVPVDNLHITMKFLGSVADTDLLRLVRALRPALAVQQAPLVGLSSVGAFPSLSRARALYVAVEGGAKLVRLQALIEEIATVERFAREERPFHPHLTIGRVKRAGRGAAVGELLAPYDGHPFVPQMPLAEVVVFESRLGERATYVPLARLPLALTP